MVDGDRLLVLAQKQIISMAKRVTKDVYPLYYEMKKARAELITPHSLYEGLRLAFTGGNIGPISNDITKIWNSGEITEESKNAVKWLCMQNNFVIDYAKTLFKPIPPKYVEDTIHKFTKQKVPYFFYYAKGKDLDQVEPINDSTINKISKEIKDNKKMFKPMKRLAPIDYLLLLKDKKDDFWSDEINMTFDRWNKRYGNNIKVGGEDDTKKNNIQQIAQQVKEDLNKIEPDDDKVLNSLVAFLYKKPSSRKKNLLWYVYGEKIYQNLSENVDHKTICRQCGARVDETLIRGKCFKCRQEEIKKKGGKKLIVCVDCGKEVQITTPKANHKHRCEKCQQKYNKEKNRLRNLAYRQKKRDEIKCS